MANKIYRYILAICISLFFSFATYGQKYDDSYNFILGIESLRNGDDNKALDYFEKEITTHQDNANAYYYIALIHYQYDNYGDALRAINNAVKYTPKKSKENLATIYILRGNILEDLDKTKDALDDYTAAIKLNPKDPDTYEARAQLYYSIEEYDLSDKDYLQMQKIDASNEMSFMGIGRNAVAQHNYTDAIKQYDYVTRLYPDYSSAFSFRAEAYAGLEKYREMADDIITALEIDGDNKAFYLMAGYAETAYTFLTTKIRSKSISNPNNPYWPYCEGVVNEYANKLPEAIELYQKAERLDPSDMTMNRIAICYSDMGNWDKAIEAINTAIEIEPTKLSYYLSKANYQNEAGLHQDAIKTMDYYIQLQPENDWAYYRRGWFKDHSGDTEGAIEDYTTAITLDPDYAYSYMNRGNLYRLLGKNEDANKDFETVLILDNEAVDNSCRQYALLYLGRKQEAIDWMQKMIDSDGPSNYYDAACLYSLMGDGEESVNYLRKAFETGFTRFHHVLADRDLDNIRNLDSYKSLMAEYMKEDKEQSNDPIDYVEKIVEIPFTRSAGVTKIKCSINDLPLSFIFDTGASTVSISSLEATFMYKNDYLSAKDFVGKSSFVDANGDISVGTIINLNSVKLGDLELKDVKASVVSNDNAPLLLGQSVLRRLGKIEIDNEKNVLKITVRENK